jgi:hypothetical protein
MPGHVCEKHERYVHEGEECPHCEPAGAAAEIQLHACDMRLPAEALEKLIGTAGFSEALRKARSG